MTNTSTCCQISSVPFRLIRQHHGPLASPTRLPNPAASARLSARFALGQGLGLLRSGIARVSGCQRRAFWCIADTSDGFRP